jgi:hypothetical protein
MPEELITVRLKGSTAIVLTDASELGRIGV